MQISKMKAPKDTGIRTTDKAFCMRTLAGTCGDGIPLVAISCAPTILPPLLRNDTWHTSSPTIQCRLPLYFCLYFSLFFKIVFKLELGMFFFEEHRKRYDLQKESG